MFSLICEGACNPSLPAVDALRREFHKRDQLPVGTPILWDAQRRLVYTPHTSVGLNRAQCAVCQTSRQFGNELRW